MFSEIVTAFSSDPLAFCDTMSFSYSRVYIFARYGRNYGWHGTIFNESMRRMCIGRCYTVLYVMFA